jgi:hypothetical protein
MGSEGSPTPELPFLTTPQPVFDARDEGRVVRVIPGGSRATWRAPGVDGTFRSRKAACKAMRGQRFVDDLVQATR